MELDKRIADGKKPLDCFDTAIAKQFIGKKGYFSNSLGWYSVLKRTWNGTLDDIESQKEQCFYDCESEGYFHYFLPAEWVKDPEKKYRPYTMNEFKAEFKIGMVLTLRNRDTPDYVCQVMYLGNRQYDESDSDNNTIFLSQRFFSLRELFNMFEIVRNGEWQPFGIEE